MALEALQNLESGEPTALAAAIRKLGAITAKGITVMRAETKRRGDPLVTVDVTKVGARRH